MTIVYQNSPNVFIVLSLRSRPPRPVSGRVSLAGVAPAASPDIRSGPTSPPTTHRWPSATDLTESSLRHLGCIQFPTPRDWHGNATSIFHEEVLKRKSGHLRVIEMEQPHQSLGSIQRIFSSGNSVLMPSSIGILSFPGVRPRAASSATSCCSKAARRSAYLGFSARLFSSRGSFFKL